jgi:hypothetical protein
MELRKEKKGLAETVTIQRYLPNRKGNGKVLAYVDELLSNGSIPRPSGNDIRNLRNYLFRFGKLTLLIDGDVCKLALRKEKKEK